MTRDDAIKILKSKMDGHTDTSYEWVETVRMAIKALEQEPILDKIRAEIIRKHFSIVEKNDFDNGRTYSYEEVLEIIDKYKGENGEVNG